MYLTIEDDQYLLVVSLVVGRRAMPVFWRAYDQSVLKGRTKRYELAVIKPAFKVIFQYVKPSRIRLTADRGFPDGDLFELLDRLKIRFIIRVKGATKVNYRGEWTRLNSLRFQGNAQRGSVANKPNPGPSMLVDSPISILIGGFSDQIRFV